MRNPTAETHILRYLPLQSLWRVCEYIHPVVATRKVLDELAASNQPWRVYTVRYVVDVPALRKRHEEMKAKKKAEEEKKEDKPGK